MSRAVIRLGDDTSHGGKVISASARMTIDGVPVALWGDHCSCPHDGHDNCVICEGEPEAMYDGIPIALEGHKTDCGATLIASQLNRCHVSPLVKANMANQSAGAPALSVFDEQIQLIGSVDGQPLSGAGYKIVTGGGKAYSGKTGIDGKTVRVRTEGPDQLKVYLMGGA